MHRRKSQRYVFSSHIINISKKRILSGSHSQGGKLFSGGKFSEVSVHNSGRGQRPGEFFALNGVT